MEFYSIESIKLTDYNNGRTQICPEKDILPLFKRTEIGGRQMAGLVQQDLPLQVDQHQTGNQVYLNHSKLLFLYIFSH